MKHVKTILVACAVLALCTVAWAALIGVSFFVGSAVTRTQFVGSITPGALDYNAVSRALNLNIADNGGNTPFSTRFAQADPLRPHLTAPTPNSMTLNIKVNLDDGSSYQGNGGPSGNAADFVLTGTIDVNGNGVFDGGDLSGVLLTGSLLQFGFQNLGATPSNPSGTPDNLDFRFAVTGGLMAPRYAGMDIGVREIIEHDNWPNSNIGGTEFHDSFQGTAKGDVIPITCGGSIGDFVWNDLNRDGVQDPGEPGLNGITVNLRNVNTNAIIATTMTANGGQGNHLGYYQFTGLCLGSYAVQVDENSALPFIPTKTGAGTPATDSNLNPSTVTLTPGNYVTGDQTIDFGFKTACTGSIGDFVWHDLNRDGTQDPLEPGLNNVVVNLRDFGGSLLKTTTTNAIGSYHFTGLCAGQYRVEVVTPVGFSPTPSHQALGDTTLDSNDSLIEVYTLLTDSDVRTDIDFGFLGQCEGAIGDFVWFDENHNGIQDANEPGIDGLNINLTGPSGPKSTTTGVNPDFPFNHGWYQFTGLCTGSYSVDVTPPAGFTPTLFQQGGNPALDSDGPVDGSAATVILPNDLSVNETIDFGFLSCPGQIGDFVWQDNGAGTPAQILNGLQNAGEPGYPGVIVNLRRPIDNALLQSNGPTGTGFDGKYLFTGLCPADYKVEVIPPVGATPSPTNVPGGVCASGTGTDCDSNPNNSIITLTLAHQSDTSIDFGYLPTGSIGDRVWNDFNGDGVQDVSEPGLPGWAVNITGPAGSGFFSSQTTVANGIYTFSNLPAAQYVVCVFPQPGYTETFDFDGIATPNCATRSITEGQHVTDVDFGYRQPASIGDRVWNDTNGNGQQFGADSGEPGLPGWQVNITGVAYANSHITGANGFYMFDNLTPGTYQVCVVPMAGYMETFDLTPPTTDNCATRTVASGEAATDVDFGYRPSVDLTVTKDDGVNFYTPATSTTYTIVVTNNGVLASNGTVVSDTKPTQIATWTWVCSNQTLGATCHGAASSSNNFSDNVNMPAGSSITYTVTANISAGATNSLVNTVTVTPPAAMFNPGTSCLASGSNYIPATGSCSDTDTDTPPPADLKISKTDGTLLYTAGGSTVYTVVVTNSGPAVAVGAVVTDTIPSQITSWAWACTTVSAGASGCDPAASSSNNFTDTVTLGVGASITYTVTANISAGATGSLINTATVAPPSGTTNPGTSCTASGAVYNPVTMTCSSTDTDNPSPPPPTGSIGDFVWNDVNANGIQDAGEPGIPGNLAVFLFDSTGAVQLAMTTTVNGIYHFTGLAAGNYIVKVPVPGGFTSSPLNTPGGTCADGTGTQCDSNGTPPGATVGFVQASVNLPTNSSSDQTIDFGFNSPGNGGTGNGTIGDFVWEDTNLNGIQDVGEQGIQNVHVELQQLSGNPPSGMAGSCGDGTPYEFHQVTDAAGHYLFSCLNAGDYKVTVVVPPGYASTKSLQGSDVQKDSNPSPSTVTLHDLGGGFVETNTSIDFGLVKTQCLSAPGSSLSSPMGTLFWGVDASGTATPGNVHVRYEQNRAVNDNSYGTNAILWSGGHSFNDLVGSDKAEFVFTNMAGTKVLDFFLDYLSAKTGTPSGYASLGPASGGDGSMVIGSASALQSFDTSLAKNLNNLGLCSGGATGTCKTTLLVNSPAASPADNTGVASGTFAGWNFTNSYEMEIKAGTFGAGNLAFGGVTVGLVHNSPAKSGSNAVTPVPCPGLDACVLGYPFTSTVARTSTVFNENGVLQAFGRTKTGSQDTVELFAADEHAPLLGVRPPAITDMTQHLPYDHASNPSIGDPTKTDPFGRPIFPAVFVTDITGLMDNASHTDLAYRAGDWQLGGAPIKLDDIFGTWKGATASGSTFTTDADPAKNVWNLGPGSDTPMGGFASLVNQGYGTEARWNVSSLKAWDPINHVQVALIPGHSYRIQLMVHDGDQNKTGGDVGEACVVFTKDAGTLDLTSADLTISKTDGVTSVLKGATTSYSVVVTNAGPNAVTGAVFKDPAATGLTSTAVTCSGAACPAAGSVTVAAMQGAGITLPALASGGSVTFTVSATVTAASGSVTNTATIAMPAGMNDTLPGNNTASDTDTVLAPVLTLTKTVNNTSVKKGDNVNYTLTYTNTGNTTATNVVITDVVPANTTFGSANSGGVNTAGTVKWTIASLAAGMSGNVQLTVKVNANAPSKAVITNTGSVQSTQTTAVSSNSVTSTVQ